MKKVIVIGDRCIDRFVYGESKRLSPEAPVPILIPQTTVENEGMASNVVQNLKAIRTLQSGYTVEGIHQQEGIIKTRYVDKKTNHMFLRVDQESKVNPLVLDMRLRTKIQEADAVIVSDYDKGFLTPELLIEISKIAKLSFIDTKKTVAQSVLENYTYIKWNESEYEKNKTLNSNLLDKIVITMGNKGAKHLNIFYPSPAPKDTIDVSGAGDTFLAAFVHKYLETQEVSTSINYANKMASIVVSKKGVATP